MTLIQLMLACSKDVEMHISCSMKELIQSRKSLYSFLLQTHQLLNVLLMELKTQFISVFGKKMQRL